MDAPIRPTRRPLAVVILAITVAGLLGACQPDGRDLGITTTGAPTWLAPGETRTFTTTATNHGTDPATQTGTLVSAPLALAPTITTDGTPCTPVVQDTTRTIVDCPHGTLAPGQTATTTVTLTGAAQPGTHTVSLHASSVGGEHTPDPHPNALDLTLTTGTGGTVDLAVQGSRNPAQSLPFSTFTSRTTVTNHAAAAASEVVVTQAIPATVPVVDATFARADGGASGTCTIAAGTVTCATGTGLVEPFDQADDRWFLDVRIGPTTTTPFTVSHAASSPHPEPAPDPSANTDEIAMQASSRYLQFTPVAPVAVGEVVEVIGGWNDAGSPWAGYANYLHVAAPDGFQVVDATINGITYACSIPLADSCIASLGTIGVTNGFTLRFLAVEAGGPVSGWAAFSSEVGGASGTLTLQAYDPAITSEIHPTFSAPTDGVVGDTSVVSGAIHNSGATDHHDVHVTIDAPGAQITSARWGDAQVPCTTAGPSASCALGTVTATEWRSLTIQVTPTTSGPLAVTVAVASTTPQQAPDPAADSQTLTIDVVERTVDLGVTVATWPTNPTVNAPYYVAITTRNHGSIPAPGTVVTATLPPTMTPTGAAAMAQVVTPGATCTVAGSTATCTLGTLPSGATQSIQVSVPISETTAGGSLDVSATSTTAEPVPDPHVNHLNQALVVDEVTADLAVWTPPLPTIVSGRTYTLTARVENDGPSWTTDAVVTADLPADWTITAATIHQGTCVVVGAQVTCTIPILYRGDRNLSLTAVAGAPTTGAALTVTVGADGLDPGPGANTSTSTFDVHPEEVDLGLSTTTGLSVTAGAQTTYVVRATNAAPTSATNVVATTTFPADVAVVSASINAGSGVTASCTVSGQVVACTMSNLDTTAVITHTIRHLQYGNPSTYQTSVTADQPESASATLPNALSFTRTPVAGDARLRVRATTPTGFAIQPQVRVYRADDGTTPIITSTAGSFTWHTLPHGHQYKVEVVLAGHVTRWWNGGTSFATATPLDAQGLSESFDLTIVMPYA